MLCREQLFSTSVHIWREMRSCRIVTLLSPKSFHFVLVWFLSGGEIACTRSCTCLELWKSMPQFVLYAEPCLRPLGCRVCYCFGLNCPEGQRVVSLVACPVFHIAQSTELLSTAQASALLTASRLQQLLVSQHCLHCPGSGNAH